MKILFVAPRFHTNQYQVIKALLNKKHNVFFHVAVLGPTEDHSLLIPTNFKQSKISLFIERLFGKGGVNKHYYFPEIFHYWNSLRNLKPDVIIIRDPYNNYFSFLAAAFSFFLKTKIIFYSQEELYRIRGLTTRLKQTSFIALFKAAWMTPIKGNNEKNTAVEHMYYVPIPIKCDLNRRNPNSVLYEEPKLLMIGKYHQERKNHLLFINAISKLREKYEFTATIVGECVTPEQQKKYNFLAKTINELNLADSIQILKNVPYKEMEHLYNSHHIFILPAVNEQYGVSVTEALGYGLPAVCTDSCGARYNIEAGENGYIIKSNSLDDLTGKLESLVSDKDMIAKMSSKSLDYARLNLSEEAFYSNFTLLLKERFKIQTLN